MREESIHIVEDNEDFRGLVRIALKREGFTVREARDGRAPGVAARDASPEALQAQGQALLKTDEKACFHA